MISKDTIDKRICDVEAGSLNTETYREFITYAERDIGVEPSNVDTMTDEQLVEHIEFLDYLLDK